jgi:hypothetical protein
MKSRLRSISKSRMVLAIVLSISLIATGCSAQWISVALADLPVLTQMALNLGTIIGTLQSGQQIRATEAAAIQNISAQASKDLNLLAMLYNQYKANPSASALQKIQSAIADINQSLPALLQAAHIGDPTLSARLTAGVNLILTTVASFAALIPEAAPQSARHSTQAATRQFTIPRVNELKKQWNEQVCGPTRNPALDLSAVGCTVR